MSKYVGPYCRAEMYAGHIASCPVVSHGEYAYGTDRRTDARPLGPYIMLSARCGQCNTESTTGQTHVCLATAEGKAEDGTENHMPVTAGRGPDIADQVIIEDLTTGLRVTIIIIVDADTDHRRRRHGQRLHRNTTRTTVTTVLGKLLFKVICYCYKLHV